MKGKYTLANLFRLAKELYDEATLANENRPSNNFDPGFFAAFFTYPIAEALS